MNVILNVVIVLRRPKSGNHRMSKTVPHADCSPAVKWNPREEVRQRKPESAEIGAEYICATR